MGQTVVIRWLVGRGDGGMGAGWMRRGLGWMGWDGVIFDFPPRSVHS